MHVGVGGNGIQVMLPSTSSEGLVNSIARNGLQVTFTTQVIKGIEYALFPGGDGFNDVTYGTVITGTATSTNVVSNLNPSNVGQPVTFTATVSSTLLGTPAGTVTVKDGATTFGTGTLTAGVATYTTTTLTSGSHAITAVYGGDTTYAGSTSGTVTQVVK